MQSSLGNSQVSTAIVGLGILLGFIAFILVVILWNRNPSAQVLTTTQPIQVLPNSFTNSMAMIITGTTTNINFQLGLPANLTDGSYLSLFVTPQNHVTFSLPSHLSWGDAPSQSTQDSSKGPFQIYCEDGFVWVYQATRFIPV